MTARSFALVTLLFGAVACSSAEGSASSASAETTAGADQKPMILVPTAPGIVSSCPDAFGVTYCGNGVQAPLARCVADIDPDVQESCDPSRGCIIAYPPDRGSCQEGPTYPTSESCDTPVHDDCSFYRSCLEAANPCGADGYALNFGERLCYRFIAEKSSFSPRGQTWLSNVRDCLQRALVPLLNEPMACDDLIDQAYASHPACYTTPDNSVCALPLADLHALVQILSADLMSKRALKQMHDVAWQCAAQLVGVSASPPSDGELTLDGDRQARIAFFRDLASTAM